MVKCKHYFRIGYSADNKLRCVGCDAQVSAVFAWWRSFRLRSPFQKPWVRFV